MNVKNFSISLCRSEVTPSEDCSAPSMVDPTLHNPTLQEIIERFTRTGEIIVNEHTPYYNGEVAEMSEIEDFVDLLAPSSDERQLTNEVKEGEVKSDSGASNPEGSMPSESSQTIEQ